MNKLVIALSSLVLFVLVSADASAGIGRHERVDIKPIKKGGEVVGMKINLTIRPEGHKSVRIGLSEAGKAPEGNNYQPAASDIKNGHLLHQFDEIKLENNEPKKVELKLMFKDNAKIKPGAAIEIVSAYPRGNGSSWHVYGMTRRAQAVDKYTVPGKAAAKRKTTINDIKRTARRTTRKTQRRSSARRQTRSKSQRQRAKSKSTPRARARGR